MCELGDQLQQVTGGDPWKKLVAMDPHAEFPSPFRPLYGEKAWNDAVAELSTRPQRMDPSRPLG